jgi:hypothetical protein
MVALSLMQPWAWLCLRPDVTEPFARAVLVLKGEIKDVENRTWRTYHRGPLLIHASKRLDKHGYRWVQATFPQIPLPRMNDLQLGGIVGRVTVRECVRGHQSRWAAADQWNWVLVDQRPLSYLPMRGRRSVFPLEASEMAQLAAHHAPQLEVRP